MLLIGIPLPTFGHKRVNDKLTQMVHKHRDHADSTVDCDL